MSKIVENTAALQELLAKANALPEKSSPELQEKTVSEFAIKVDGDCEIYIR